MQKLKWARSTLEASSINESPQTRNQNQTWQQESNKNPEAYLGERGGGLASPGEVHSMIFQPLSPFKMSKKKVNPLPPS